MNQFFYLFYHSIQFKADNPNKIEFKLKGKRAHKHKTAIENHPKIEPEQPEDKQQSEEQSPEIKISTEAPKVDLNIIDNYTEMSHEDRKELERKEEEKRKEEEAIKEEEKRKEEERKKIDEEKKEEEENSKKVREKEDFEHIKEYTKELNTLIAKIKDCKYTLLSLDIKKKTILEKCLPP